jgi:hypothetical protein
MDLDLHSVRDSGFLQPGRYFCRVMKAAYCRSKANDLGFDVEFACIAGESAGQVISTMMFGSKAGDPTASAVMKLKIFIEACGLLPPAGERLHIEPHQLLNRELWVTVEPGKPFQGLDGTMKEGFPQVGFRGFEAGQRPGDYNPNIPGAFVPPTPAPVPAPAAPQPTAAPGYAPQGAPVQPPAAPGYVPPGCAPPADPSAPTFP